MNKKEVAYTCKREKLAVVIICFRGCFIIPPSHRIKKNQNPNTFTISTELNLKTRPKTAEQSTVNELELQHELSGL